ncbi:MAG TPA: hypothetical protein ENN66_04520 [Proteobacteria bacterium]|nr:hypothetical protein [Pseudomonadota bacterium]
MKKTFFCLILILWLASPGLLRAATGDFSCTPSLQFRAEYDDNINFDNENEKSDWLGVFIPTLTASWRTPRIDLKSSLEGEIRRFAAETRYNDEYQRYRLNGSFQATEKLVLEGGAAYTKDSILDSELKETGIVEGLYARKRGSLDAKARYRLGERLFSGFSYGYSDTTYDSPNDIDYDSHSLVGSISYLRRNQRDQFFLQPQYYRYNSEISTVDNYGLSLGWTRELSEKLSLTCYLGLRYTESEYRYSTWIPFFDSGSGLISWRRKKLSFTEDDWGGTADISLSGRTETLTYKLAYNRDLSYTSTGSPIDRDRLTGSLRWTVSRRLHSGFAAGLYFSKANDDYNDEDSTYFYLHPDLSWQLTEKHSLQLHYLYAATTDKTLSDNRSYDRNRVWLALVFNFPRLLD